MLRSKFLDVWSKFLIKPTDRDFPIFNKHLCLCSEWDGVHVTFLYFMERRTSSVLPLKAPNRFVPGKEDVIFFGFECCKPYSINTDLEAEWKNFTTSALGFIVISSQWKISSCINLYFEGGKLSDFDAMYCDFTLLWKSGTPCVLGCCCTRQLWKVCKLFMLDCIRFHTCFMREMLVEFLTKTKIIFKYSNHSIE